jgi:deoxyribodipyrimidine photo-lyase
MRNTTSLLWFRQDLRVRDNTALQAAVAAGGPVVPVFIWAPEEESPWAPGAASRCWLERSLRSLDRSLRARGSRLVLRRGTSRDCLRDLVEHTGARAVFWNRLCEPRARVRDAAVEDSLRREGLQVRTFNAALLFEPREILNAMGNPYKVFTPFWNACLKAPAPPPPGRAPSRIPALSHWPASLDLEDLGVRPASHPWQEKILSSWRPGEDGAVQQLKRFLRKAHAAYARLRDRPDVAGTSRLSPHLHFQENTISCTISQTPPRGRCGRSSPDSRGRATRPP